MIELQRLINNIMAKISRYDPQLIGARVMAFRELIGASRDQLAKSLNVSSTDLQDIENGEIHDDVFFPIFKKLVNEYGINSAWLNYGKGTAFSKKGPKTPEGIFQFMQRLEQKKAAALILTFIINPIIDDVYADILAAQRDLKTELFSKKTRELKGSQMSELLKELCRLAGMISNLAVTEKNPEIKKGILKLYIMVSEKIEKAGEDPELNTGNAFFSSVIEKIEETVHLVTGYKQQANTFSDLLDHVLKIMNEVEGLYFAVELSAKSSNID